MYVTPNNEQYQVVKSIDECRYLVRFTKSNNYQIADISIFGTKRLKDCSQNLVFGVGYATGTPENPVILSDGSHERSREVWYQMISRCYKDGGNRAYKDVTVCDEWHNYMAFRAWYLQNCDLDNPNRFELDKDLFSGDSKIYSPQTCCFIPQEINSTLKGLKKYDKCNISETSAKTIYHLSLLLDKYNDYLAENVREKLSSIVSEYSAQYKKVTGRSLQRDFKSIQLAKSDLSQVKITAFVKYYGHIQEFTNAQELRDFIKKVEKDLIFKQ